MSDGARNNAAADETSPRQRGYSPTPGASQSLTIGGSPASVRAGAAKVPRLLSARCPSDIGHPVKARQRADSPGGGIQQRLAGQARKTGGEPADGAKRLADPFLAARHRFDQHAPVDQLKGDVDEVVLVDQANAIGAADPGRAAEPREKVAQIVQRLRVDEAPDRLLDQRDMRFAEELIDIFRRPADDPVERQLEQIGAGLDTHAVVARRGAARFPPLNVFARVRHAVIIAG